MIGGSQNLDEVDRAFLGSVVPPDGLDPKLLAVVSWIDADTGEGRFVVYTPDDDLLSSKLGILELAKIQLVQEMLSDDG